MTQRGVGKENQEGIVRSNTLGMESLFVRDLCPLTQLLAEKVKLHEGVRIQSSIKWVLLGVPSLALGPSCAAKDQSLLSECLRKCLGSMKKEKAQRHCRPNSFQAAPWEQTNGLQSLASCIPGCIPEVSVLHDLENYSCLWTSLITGQRHRALWQLPT